jgi:DNA-binding MarR family transcriptional regulator
MRLLGYWLKHIDGLLEDTFDQLLDGEGLTRRHWQVLNTLATGPHTMTGLAEAMHPFDNVQTTVDELTRRGWVTGAYELTEHGRQAHREVQAKVLELRAKTREGISDEEFGRLLTLLERVATNVANAR